MRQLSVLLIAVAALGVTACGGGSSPSTTTTGMATSTGSASTATPGTGNARPATLTADGYAALVAFTRLTNRKQSAGSMSKRCSALQEGSTDPQVGAIRETCLALADIQQASKDVEGCAKEQADLQARRTCLADGLDQIAAYSRDAMTAGRRVVSVGDLAPGPCRAYLLDPVERARLRSFARSAEAMASAFRDTGASPARLQAASNRLEIAFRRFARVSRTLPEELAQAAACRPA